MEKKDQIHIWRIGLQTFLIVLGVIVAIFQLDKMAVQMRGDFTYKVYQDHERWLNDHREFKKWIYYDKQALLEPNYEKWELDDFLRTYETLARLENKGLVDKDVAYALFSYPLMTAFEAHDFELRKIIQGMRKSKNDAAIFSGVEDLYKEMKEVKEADKAGKTPADRLY